MVPIAAVILIGLFAIQRHGSGQVGKLFGPAMLGWFSLLAIMGLFHSVDHPEVFRARDPRYAVSYLAHANGWTAFAVLGSI